MTALIEYEADQVIRTFAKVNNKVIIGESAGAIVCGPNLALVNFIETGASCYHSQNLMSGLGLYDFYILPHAHRYSGSPLSFREDLNMFEKETGKCVYELNDGEGILLTVE